MVVKSLMLAVLALVVLVVILSGCASDKQNYTPGETQNTVQKPNVEAIRNQIEINKQIHQKGIDALTN